MVVETLDTTQLHRTSAILKIAGKLVSMNKGDILEIGSSLTFTSDVEEWCKRYKCAAGSGVGDEGRPLATGLQEQVANHRKRLRSKPSVVSVTEKVSKRYQVRTKEDEHQ